MMKKFFVLSLLVLFTLTLAACQRDEEEKEHAQGVLDDKILIGNTAVTTGDFGFVGQPFIAGMEAYLDMVNEKGGVFGRDIEIVHYSDGFDADTGMTYTQRLFEDDEIFAFVGHFGTPTVAATAEYLNLQGIPRVYYGTGTSTVATEEAEGGQRASFPVQPVYEFEGEMMLARAVGSFDAEKVGLLYTGDEVGLEIKAGMERLNEELDVEIVSYQVAGDDHDTEALSIVDADVDTVVLGMNQAPAVTSIYALLGQGLADKPVLTSYVCADASFVEFIYGALGAFPIYSNAWVNLFDEEGDWSEAYLEFQAEISKVDPDLEANTFAIAGWIAAMVFVEGMYRLEEQLDEDDAITWEAFIDAMESDIFEYPFGAPIDYRDGKRLGTQIMSLLQMQYDAEEEVGYFDVVEDFQSIDELLD